jgi:hypothetical protein
MATYPDSQQAKKRSPYRLAAILVAGALLVGVAAGALSYLGSSLVVGPAIRAGTDELRERGARIYFESCAGFSVEPRFWPECVGDVDEKRERGAQKLVEFCTGQDRYVRFFGPQNCLAEDRPLLLLTAGPTRQDLVVGGVVAAVSLVGFGLLSVLSGVLVRRPLTGSLGPPVRPGRPGRP